MSITKTKPRMSKTPNVQNPECPKPRTLNPERPNPRCPNPECPSGGRPGPCDYDDDEHAWYTAFHISFDAILIYLLILELTGVKFKLDNAVPSKRAVKVEPMRGHRAQ